MNINLQQYFNFFSSRAPVSIFHSYHKPPYGGSNQFILALEKAIKSQGISVARNKADNFTKACLLNAYVFDYNYVKSVKQKYKNIRIIHRVDGPIQRYRGFDDGTDCKIGEINFSFADATIFQSGYSFDAYKQLGLIFNKPIIIPNAVDNTIFHSRLRLNLPDGKRKVRLIAVSWSDNPRKGAPWYKWLEDRLDWNRYEFTFLGRSRENFNRLRHIGPLASEKVAVLLRSHDIYLTASQEESCSNSLLEALACGLPAVYLNSGGNKELVKEAGIGFGSKEEMLVAIDKVINGYVNFKKAINIMTLEEIAKRYIDVLLGA